MEITVIGGGVIGLTTAIELRRAGHDAHVVAAARAHDATSVVAGAIWGPTSVAPQHRTGPWALESRRRYVDIATDPTSGVAPMTHVDLQADDESHWGETTPWVTRLGPDEVPAGYGSALAIDGFRIDPPVYLSWLERELDDTGGDWTEFVTGTSAELSGRPEGWDLPDHDVAVIDMFGNTSHIEVVSTLRR